MMTTITILQGAYEFKGLKEYPGWEQKVGAWDYIGASRARLAWAAWQHGEPAELDLALLRGL